MLFKEFIIWVANGWHTFLNPLGYSQAEQKRMIHKLRLEATLEMLCCAHHHATHGEVITLANPPVIARSYTQTGDYNRAQTLFDLADMIERERIAGRPVPVWRI